MTDTQGVCAGYVPPPTDLFTVEHFLSEEERQVRDRVRTFVQQRVPVMCEKCILSV